MGKISLLTGYELVVIIIIIIIIEFIAPYNRDFRGRRYVCDVYSSSHNITQTRYYEMSLDEHSSRIL